MVGGLFVCIVTQSTSTTNQQNKNRQRFFHCLLLIVPAHYLQTIDTSTCTIINLFLVINYYINTYTDLSMV